jgi:hypothetical protein
MSFSKLSYSSLAKSCLVISSLLKISIKALNLSLSWLMSASVVLASKTFSQSLSSVPSSILALFLIRPARVLVQCSLTSRIAFCRQVAALLVYFFKISNSHSIIFLA